MPVRDLEQRTHLFGVLAGEETVRRQLRADHARQPQRPIEFGGSGCNVHQRQRGMGGKAAWVLPADLRKTVVDGPAQRNRHLKRLGLDPAAHAQERQHAGSDALAVHSGKVAVYVVKRLGYRLFADPRLQHLDAVLVAHNARFPRAGAQCIDQFGGSPVCMHVDHGSLLYGWFNFRNLF